MTSFLRFTKSKVTIIALYMSENALYLSQKNNFSEDIFHIRFQYHPL